MPLRVCRAAGIFLLHLFVAPWILKREWSMTARISTLLQFSAGCGHKHRDDLILEPELRFFLIELTFLGA